MYEVTSIYGQIHLGKQGENLARRVSFNEPAIWKKDFGEGKCELLHQRNGDGAPYPIVLEIDGDNVYWNISDADTAFAGNGKCEMRYIVDDVVIKSRTWVTTVFEAFEGDVVEAPEPQKTWVDQVMDAADEVKSAAIHQPMIGQNGNWFVWDFESTRYVDSGVCAEGKGGADGSVWFFGTQVNIDGGYPVNLVTGAKKNDIYLNVSSGNVYRAGTTYWEYEGNIKGSTGEAAEGGADLSDSLPIINGQASAGISDEVSRADHVHPTDTTRMPGIDELDIVSSIGLSDILPLYSSSSSVLAKIRIGILSNFIKSQINSVPKADTARALTDANGIYSATIPNLTGDSLIALVDDIAAALVGYATEEFVKGYAQAKGNYVTEDNLNTVTEGILAEAKESGEFDGVSVAHSWNGTILTVTAASGTSSADLKGPQGDAYTLTEADKAEIVRMVIESLGGNPVFGYVDKNNNIIVSGNLEDGTYSVKYEMEDGSTVDIGNLVLDTDESDEPETPIEKNYFNASTASLNQRISTSGELKDCDGMVTTDYIPWEDVMSGKNFYLSGVDTVLSTTYNYRTHIAYYDETKTLVTRYADGGELDAYLPINYGNYSGGGFIRISIVLKDDEAITADDVAALTITLK